ncbi:MAG: CBS domain-containing protein [Bacteroidetes bacterium]|nr:CBS domain-containing protein [Bacteroidota bacterium]
MRDFFKSISKSEIFNIDELIQQPLFVPENMDAQMVLSQLRQGKTHICCVINEYGSFEGLITLHDIIENIIGQIPEQDEIYEPDVFIREDNSTLVSGDAPVETLSDIIDDFLVDFDKIDYSTVAGFVINHLNNFTRVGDKVVLRELYY